MSSGSLRWFLVVLVVALVLRLALLGSKSIWVDEAFSIWQAERSPAEIWSTTNDNHPPLYYLLLKAWIGFGTSETVVRLPSALISLVGLSLLYVLGRRLSGEKVALFAVILLALSPLDLWYAQEARMYIFVASAALLIALGLSRMSLSGAVLVAAGLALGLYLDYSIIPLWIILSSIWLVLWWQGDGSGRQILAWFVGSLAGWLLFFPLWSHLSLVAGRMSSIFILENIREAAGLPAFGTAIPLLGMIVLALLTGALTYLVREILASPRIGHIAAAVVVLLFMLVTILMPVPRMYSVKRLLVTGWPFVVLGVAWLATEKARKPVLAQLSLIGVSLIASLISLLAVPKDDWRGAVAYINQFSKAGDIVWLEPSSGHLPYDYYDPSIKPVISLNQVEEDPSAGVWHIAERQPNRPIPGSSAEVWLDVNRELLSVHPLYRLEVRHYSPAE